ncbi:hypothetical protein P20495_1984 [Pseudoalteromonas sp. BSi20495]|nr:hypothetical protein P20495_1984 [Pseudoalteromonas sp. BSi20495]
MYCVGQVCRALNVFCSNVAVLNVCILKMDKPNHLINDIGMIDK